MSPPSLVVRKGIRNTCRALSSMQGAGRGRRIQGPWQRGDGRAGEARTPRSGVGLTPQGKTNGGRRLGRGAGPAGGVARQRPGVPRAVRGLGQGHDDTGER